MQWRQEEILMLVKVYPTPSKKYGETVCSAGITRDGQWIRVYPVPYRDLRPNQQFAKFQWIRAQVSSAKEKLSRPESHKIDPASIELLEKIPAGNQWGERERYFLPYVSKSLETLLQKQRDNKISLGAFQPKTVSDFLIEPTTDEWSTSQQGILNQTTLFHTDRPPLAKIPYTFHYRYTCDDPLCHGHTMRILDWEVYESYRRWKRIYKDEKTTKEKLKEKWFDYFFRERESYFVVGTESEFGKFMILTVVSPRRKEQQMQLEF